MGVRIKFTEEQLEEMVKLHTEEHLSVTAIARQMGYDKKTIKRRLIEQGVEIQNHKYTYQIGDKLGPYGATLVERLEQYVSESGKVYNGGYGKFLCPFHEEKDPHYFIASIRHVANGHTKQCKECWKKERVEILERAHEANRRDYSGEKTGKLLWKEYAGYSTPHGDAIWICQCDCGNICKVSTNHFGETLSCGCLVSKGEQKVLEILLKDDIKHEVQYSFEDCINPETNTKLRFDFYLPDYNCCIEYNGAQHYNHKDAFFGQSLENFKKAQARDEIKRQYCKDNDIKLIEIPYTDYNILDSDYIKERLAA